MGKLSTISSVLFFICTIHSTAPSALPAVELTSRSNSNELIPANVTMTLFTDLECGHSSQPIFTEVAVAPHYGLMKPAGFVVLSYNLSRDLLPEERLDWSNPYPPNSGVKAAQGAIPTQCEDYLETTNPDSNNNELHASTCYQIAAGASVSGRSWKNDYTSKRLTLPV